MTERDREQEKADRELRVFLGFARVARLAVIPGSARSRRPPEPDILCEIACEGLVAFELVELVDSGLAESTSVAARTKVPTEAVYVGDPTLDRIRAKIRKTYETPHPVELVAWANPMITPPSVWLPTYESRIKELDGLTRFRRTWVLNLGGPPGERGVWLAHPPRVASDDSEVSAPRPGT